MPGINDIRANVVSNSALTKTRLGQAPDAGHGGGVNRRVSKDLKHLDIALGLWHLEKDQVAKNLRVRMQKLPKRQDTISLTIGKSTNGVADARTPQQYRSPYEKPRSPLRKTLEKFSLEHMKRSYRAYQQRTQLKGDNSAWQAKLNRSANRSGKKLLLLEMFNQRARYMFSSKKKAVAHLWKLDEKAFTNINPNLQEDLIVAQEKKLLSVKKGWPSSVSSKQDDYGYVKNAQSREYIRLAVTATLLHHGYAAAKQVKQELTKAFELAHADPQRSTTKPELSAAEHQLQRKLGEFVEKVNNGERASDAYLAVLPRPKIHVDANAVAQFIVHGDKTRLEFENELADALSMDRITPARKAEYERLARIDPAGAASALTQEYLIPEQDLHPQILKSLKSNVSDAVRQQAAAGLHDEQSAGNNQLSRDLAKLLMDDQGRFNVVLARKLLNDPALLKAKDSHTQHVRNTLIRLSDPDNSALRNQLNSISAPQPNNPAADMIRGALDLEPGQTITNVEARQGALSSLLADMRQSNVGSCFGTSTAVAVHDTQQSRFLAEMKQLIEQGQVSIRRDNRNPLVESIATSTDVKEMRQPLSLDRQGNLVKVGDKELGAPQALTQIPPMRAAFKALQIPVWEQEAALKQAVARCQGAGNLNAERIVENLAYLRGGLTPSEVDSLAQIDEANRTMQQLSGISQQNSSEGREARRVIAQKRRLVENLVRGFGNRYRQKVETKLAAENSASQAKIAFQSQQDNPLLRAWEFTISSLAARDDKLDMLNNVRKVLTGTVRVQNNPGAAKNLGLDAFFNIALKKGTLPAVDTESIGQQDRQTYKGTDEEVFLKKFNAMLIEEFEHQLTARMTFRYDASARSTQASRDGRSKGGGFVLHSSTGDPHAKQMMPLNTPAAFQAFMVSVYQDVARTMIAGDHPASQDMMAQQSIQLKAHLQQAVDATVRHGMSPDFTKFIANRATQSSNVFEGTINPPWEPTQRSTYDGDGHFANTYYGHTNEAERIKVRKTGKNEEDDFAENLIVNLRSMRTALQQADGRGHKKVLVPVTISSHGFNINTDDPTLRPAWKEDANLIREQPLSFAEQKKVLNLLLNTHGEKASPFGNFELLKALTDKPRTAQELQQWVAKMANDKADLFHNPERFKDPDNDSDTSVLASAHAVLFVKNKLLKPMHALASKTISVNQQKSVVTDAFKKLKIAVNPSLLAKILGSLEGASRTPAQLHRHIVATVKKDAQLMTALEKEYGNEGAVSSALEALLTRYGPPPPRMTIGDMSWRSGGHHVNLSLIGNPTTGKVEPWLTLDNGSLALNSSAKKLDPEEYQYFRSMLTNPSQYGYN